MAGRDSIVSQAKESRASALGENDMYSKYFYILKLSFFSTKPEVIVDRQVSVIFI